MPTKADPGKLRRELTENRYRLTDYDVRQHPSGDNWWVTLCGDPAIGPFDSEREAWQGLEDLLERAQREKEFWARQAASQSRKKV